MGCSGPTTGASSIDRAPRALAGFDAGAVMQDAISIISNGGHIMSSDDCVERYEHAGCIVEIGYDHTGWSPQDNDNAGTLVSWDCEWTHADMTRNGKPYATECATCEGSGWVITHRTVSVQRVETVTAVTPDASARDPFATALGYRRGGGVQHVEHVAVSYEPGDGCHGGQDECPTCEGCGEVPATLAEWYAVEYGAVVVLPVEYYSYGSKLVITDEDARADGVIFLTQDDIDREWSGDRARAESYLRDRIEELSNYLQGNVYAVTIRKRTPPDEFGEQPDAEDDGDGDELDSCGCFIGGLYGKSGDYIREDANMMAEDCARWLADEAAEAQR